MREQLGTDYYQFGYHSMNNVFVQPAALIRGLADTLPDNVWLMENNPVESVDGGGPYIVRTRNGPFSADNVILANNASRGGWVSCAAGWSPSTPTRA